MFPLLVVDVVDVDVPLECFARGGGAGRTGTPSTASTELLLAEPPAPVLPLLPNTTNWPSRTGRGSPDRRR